MVEDQRHNGGKTTSFFFAPFVAEVGILFKLPWLQFAPTETMKHQIDSRSQQLKHWPILRNATDGFNMV